MSFKFRRVVITLVSTLLAVIAANGSALRQVQDGNLVVLAAPKFT